MTDSRSIINAYSRFVGTEGLRGVVQIILNRDAAHPIAITDQDGAITLAERAADRYLLSLLAEGLARAGYKIATVPECRSVYMWHPHRHLGSEPDYRSAILAAAAVEWPKKNRTIFGDPVVALTRVRVEFRPIEWETREDGVTVFTKTEMVSVSLIPDDSQSKDASP